MINNITDASVSENFSQHERRLRGNVERSALSENTEIENPSRHLRTIRKRKTFLITKTAFSTLSESTIRVNVEIEFFLLQLNYHTKFKATSE